MLSEKKVRELALSFEASEEAPHFEKTSFRISKRIFATLDTEKKRVTMKLSAVNQSVFSCYDKEAVYPVPNNWGKQGWTIFELKKVRADIFKDALTQAYCLVAPKKLADKYRQEG